MQNDIVSHTGRACPMASSKNGTYGQNGKKNRQDRPQRAGCGLSITITVTGDQLISLSSAHLQLVDQGSHILARLAGKPILAVALILPSISA
jgi:hypothetical protein